MTMTGPAQNTLSSLLSWLEERRRQGNVRYDDKQQSWQVLGHPEAIRVLGDPATFSSDLRDLTPRQEDLELFRRGNFVRMDPPRHRKLRGLVSQAFTPEGGGRTGAPDLRGDQRTARRDRAVASAST